MWWEDAVIYQVYIRSFQDSDGDGIGDLAGVLSRLDHIAWLGAAAVWLSPPYPSPNADFGYDVADFTAVDSAYGTLDVFDRLVAGAHERGLRVLLDFVPAHTSIEHPWFRTRRDFYFWADSPPNNWRATFGGSAWQRDPDASSYYLHTFFPEQADLNWRHPPVAEEMGAAMRFWRARGVDGFRLDAVNGVLKDPELRDDPPATEPFPLPLHEEYARLSHIHSNNAPDIGMALQAMRDAGGDAFLVGEAYLPTSQLKPYAEVLDSVFAFEAMNAGPAAARLKAAIAEGRSMGGIGWVLSNHDFTRFATRFGPSARAAAMLFLSLPGPVFMYQGDELGIPDGPGADPPQDRAGRDGFRHPMPWDGSAKGGFTTGTPWLPPIGSEQRNVAAQREDPSSTLELFRRLIALRPQLAPDLRFVDSPDQTVVFDRGEYRVAVNFASQPAPVRRSGELRLEARAGDGADPDLLPAYGGWIARRQAG